MFVSKTVVQRGNIKLLRNTHSTSAFKKTMLRPATAADADFFYGLYFHPQINPFLLYEMMPRVEFQPIFENLLHQAVLYVFHNDDANIGMLKLIPHTYRASHVAYLGGVAIHPDFGGHGYGEQMLREMLAMAVARGVLRVELSVGVANAAAIRLYEKVGFQTEGILRRYNYLKSEGRFIDEQLMSCLL